MDKYFFIWETRLRSISPITDTSFNVKEELIICKRGLSRYITKEFPIMILPWLYVARSIGCWFSVARVKIFLRSFITFVYTHWKLHLPFRAVDISFHTWSDQWGYWPNWKCCWNCWMTATASSTDTAQARGIGTMNNKATL